MLAPFKVNAPLFHLARHLTSLFVGDSGVKEERGAAQSNGDPLQATDWACAPRSNEIPEAVKSYLYSSSAIWNSVALDPTKGRGELRGPMSLIRRSFSQYLEHVPFFPMVVRLGHLGKYSPSHRTINFSYWPTTMVARLDSAKE